MAITLLYLKSVAYLSYSDRKTHCNTTDAPAYNFKIGWLGTKAKRGEETFLSGTMFRQWCEVRQQHEVKGKLKAYATVSPSWVTNGDTAMCTKPQALDESYRELKTGSSPRLTGNTT